MARPAAEEVERLNSPRLEVTGRRRPPLDLPARLFSHLSRCRQLLPRDSTVLVALSGGPDSMALLHLLREVAPEHPLRVRAAHFDHGLRLASASEAERVAGWAAEYGIPVSIGRPPRRLEGGHAEFRHARYRFLRAEAERTGADRIATAHHRDDQAETVLLRLLRGTGVRGLAGIPRRRGRIVRPLLDFWKEEIRAYVAARRIPYLEDPSNRDLRWARARVRHRLIPALERGRRRTVSRDLLSVAAAARAADRALDAAALEVLRQVRLPDGRDGRIRIARSGLAAHDRALQAQALRAIAANAGTTLSRGGTRAAVEFIMRGRSGSEIHLSERLRLGREYDALWLGPPLERPDEVGLTIERAAPGHASVRIGGQAWTLEWGSPGRISAQGSMATLPLRASHFPLRIRGPRPGDRIRLQGGSRKLKRLFSDRRVPLSQRGRTPVVAGASGELLWVAGVAVAQIEAERGETAQFEIGISESTTGYDGRGTHED